MGISQDASEHLIIDQELDTTYIDMFGCTHKWKLLSETTTESKFQHSMAIARKNDIVGKFTIPHQMCDASRRHIQTFACDECGKLKRFVDHI